MTDVLWLLVCAGLVFLMQPGFMCLESGLTRSKNSINVAIKNLADFGVSVALFWAFGYALMFGATRSGWIGTSGFFLEIDRSTHLAAFFLFAAMFCGTATTIVSGAVAERMKFTAYLVVASWVSGLIYPVFGHWVWNGANDGVHVGWLAKLGFVDFAGSTVVHSVGGWVALAALLVVGSRTGRFPENAPPQKIHGANLQLSVLGGMLLWFGWLGFNGGSTLRLTEQVASIMGHTVLAGVAGMLSALLVGWRLRQVPEVELTINGSLAGLVSVTACCHVISTPMAVLVGAVGGIVMVGAIALLNALRIDDAVDAVAVHVGGGIWGTLSVALFGNLERLHTGLTRPEQLAVQLFGIFVGFVWAFGLTYLWLTVLHRFVPLRVSLEEEHIGLNVSEHRAKTEIYDLFKVMDSQAQTQDLSLRVPVEPFTEVGQIALRYNQVMDALEEAVSRTRAIVETASDAIVTFHPVTLQVTTANPIAEQVFGYSYCDRTERNGKPSNLLGKSLHQLVELPAGKVPHPCPTGGKGQHACIAEATRSHYGLQTAIAPEFRLASVPGSSGAIAPDPRYILHILLQEERLEVLGRRADGTLFPLEATLSKAELGDRSFYNGIFRDISDRKRAEEALAKANREIIALNQQLKAENVRLSAEIDITRRLQQMLLPKEKELSQIPGLDIAGYMEPATEVGGDYYDVLQHNGLVKIGMGDVTGHGLESGVLTIMVQTAVRTLLENEETDPKKFLSAINRAIYHNVQRMKSDRNTSLILLDYKQGALRLSGQHEEVLIVRACGAIERIDTLDLGFPLGLEEDITDFVAQIHMHLDPGDGIVLYTDGITEAENTKGEHYGLERLCQVVTQHWHLPARHVMEAAIADVRRYIGDREVYDDISLLILKQKEENDWKRT